MIPRQPEPPALPGVIPTPAPWYRRLWELAARYRWEALPYYAATAHGTFVELYAYLDPPGAAEIAAFSTVAALSAAGAVLCAAKDWSKGVVVTVALTTCMGWTAWQAADPSPAAGLLILAPATTAAGIPYWRELAKARLGQVQRDHDVQMAKLDVMREAVKARAAIPGQRQPAVIETFAEQGQPRESTPWRPPGNTTVRQPVPIGPSTDLDIVGGHILIAGRTRAGKSVLQGVIISSLLPCTDANIVGVDMKPGALELGPFRAAGVRVAATPKEAEHLIGWILAEGDRRGAILGVSYADTGTIKRKWHATPEDPHIVLVIDEMAELIRQAGHLAQNIETVLAVLTALGITLIICTQLPGNNVFGGRTDGRANIDTRICLGTSEPLHTRMTLGDDATKLGYEAHLLEQPGEFYIRSHRHRRPVVDRGYDLTDERLAAHIAAHAKDVVVDPADEPEAFPAPAEPAKPGRIDNATELITAYLREHGPSTPEDVARGLGHYPDKLKSFRNLMRRHAANGLFKTVGDGTKYAVNDRTTLTGNIVRFPSRRNA